MCFLSTPLNATVFCAGVLGSSRLRFSSFTGLGCTGYRDGTGRSRLRAVASVPGRAMCSTGYTWRHRRIGVPRVGIHLLPRMTRLGVVGRRRLGLDCHAPAARRHKTVLCEVPPSHGLRAVVSSPTVSVLTVSPSYDGFTMRLPRPFPGAWADSAGRVAQRAPAGAVLCRIVRCTRQSASILAT